MIERSRFTAGQGDPPYPVPLSDNCTVPTTDMAYYLAKLLATDGKVLEIGTGSGFQCAVLAEICKEVVSIEAAPRTGVEELLPENVTTIHGMDGCQFDTGEKFDGVLVTFGSRRIMHCWFNQLKEGGRLVVPKTDGRLSKICVYQRKANALELVDVAGYAPFTEQEAMQ